MVRVVLKMDRIVILQACPIVLQLTELFTEMERIA